MLLWEAAVCVATQLGHSLKIKIKNHLAVLKNIFWVPKNDFPL